jgi:hypothetical protein
LLVARNESHEFYPQKRQENLPYENNIPKIRVARRKGLLLFKKMKGSRRETSLFPYGMLRDPGCYANRRERRPE